jgi:hypothetical protein|nr:MAG TPA: protein of unknown function (DUF4790) [Caudoviricetes sp.]
MGRLIDADNLQFNGRNYNKSQMKAILDFIDSQPTAYDVDTVVKQLANSNRWTDGTYDFVRLERAIEIVKGGGVDEME